MSKNYKEYSREEKLDYYARRVLRLEKELERAKQRLAWVKSDEYQDWNSTLQGQLDELKKAK